MRPAPLAFATVALVLVSFAGSARAEVFRDRASFEAATQNLHLVDFEDRSENVGRTSDDFRTWVRGVAFGNSFSSVLIDTRRIVPNRTLLAHTFIPEINILTIFLPPGTTAVAVEQFERPVELRGGGHSVMLGEGDTNNFVGITSETPMELVQLVADFPEPATDIEIDNLLFGQRRGGNQPAPVLLVTNTGRAGALDSVAKTGEPFTVAASNTRNLSADQRTRVTLFLAGVGLTNEDLPFITVQAEDSQGRVFDLPVEGVGRAKNTTWMAEVVVRLPDAIAGAGDVQVGVTVRGAASNRAKINVAPDPN